MIITKFSEFLNESSQDGVLKFRTEVLNILKTSSDKITKSNVSIVKDGKKVKLTSTVVDGHKPRYDKGTPANSLHPEQPASANTSTANEPFNFVISCAGSPDAIADYKVTVTSGNEVSLANNLDAKDEVAKFNKHNVKYIPDHIQQKLEQKFGKVQTA